MPSEPESPEFRYKTPIDQCDVVNRKRLEAYRDKRYEWLSWYELRKGEPNTIQQQLFSMMFFDLTYRILASARQGTNEGPSFAAQSGLLAHFLDQGYVATQVLSIRRLLDARKDVFSLRRLLDDLTKCRELITRENYVCHDGLLREIQERMDAAELLGLNYYDVLNGEQAAEDIEELETALQDYCLPYFYFGAHPGDGADFGYWLSEGFTEDFDGLKVDDTSEIPTGYTGEVLHVNDHGNCTLYACSRGKRREIWGIV